MVGHIADLAMVLLGVVSAVLLVVYGLLAAGGTSSAALFWVIVIAFLGYIVWDIRRHLRATRPQAPTLTGRNP